MYHTNDHDFAGATLDDAGTLHIVRRGKYVQSYAKRYLRDRLALAAELERKTGKAHPRADLWCDLWECRERAKPGPPPEVLELPEFPRFPDRDIEPGDISDLSWSSLRALAKKLGVTGKSRAALVDGIREVRGG